jgi:hypothetical protein
MSIMGKGRSQRTIPAIHHRYWCRLAWLGVTIPYAALLLSCGGSDRSETSASIDSTPSPTAAPRDPAAAEAALHEFVEAVQSGRLEDAWSLYAASVPGDTTKHRADRGCDYGVFTFEFPNMQHLFQRAAPFQVNQWYGSALGVTVVELSVRGRDGADYLATLARALDHEPYQLMFLNNGRPAFEPGVPDTFPSPEDPRGFCGIWTGSR